MNDEETQAYYARCITTTSTDYARYYIKLASLDTLKKCLGTIEGRGASKTLRKMIERRIRQLVKRSQ